MLICHAGRREGDKQSVKAASTILPLVFRIKLLPVSSQWYICFELILISAVKSWNFRNVTPIYVRQNATVMCHTRISQFMFSVTCCKSLQLSAGMCDITRSCDSHRHISNDIASKQLWGTLASLVTSGLQSQDCNTTTGSWKVVNLPSFVLKLV